MIDPHRYLRALEGPPPPEEAPALPAERPARRGWLVAAAAVAVGACLLLAMPWEPPADEPDPQAEWALRGAEPPTVVDLRLAVQRAGVMERASAGETYTVGDRVFLQLAASAPAHVSAWVDHLDTREALGALDADREPKGLRSDGGLVAYDLGEPGRFAFCASTGDNEACAPPSCTCWELEVR